VSVIVLDSNSVCTSLSKLIVGIIRLTSEETEERASYPRAVPCRAVPSPPLDTPETDPICFLQMSFWRCLENDGLRSYVRRGRLRAFCDYSGRDG
jgi:hypothetical protein